MYLRIFLISLNILPLRTMWQSIFMTAVLCMTLSAGRQRLKKCIQELLLITMLQNIYISLLDFKPQDWLKTV